MEPSAGPYFERSVDLSNQNQHQIDVDEDHEILQHQIDVDEDHEVRQRQQFLFCLANAEINGGRRSRQHFSSYRRRRLFGARSSSR
jgi:hypothetical protein